MVMGGEATADDDDELDPELGVVGGPVGEAVRWKLLEKWIKNVFLIPLNDFPLLFNVFFQKILKKLIKANFNSF